MFPFPLFSVPTLYCTSFITPAVQTSAITRLFDKGTFGHRDVLTVRWYTFWAIAKRVHHKSGTSFSEDSDGFIM
ncbi:hypothetical protein AB6A40_010557 [Gnathostoma spinigerum]|uniref:Secreted protein n=1 Tax=Gnathostoma spinigerum TaxID=75299 RepID=A0ABD6F1Y7_9BILA